MVDSSAAIDDARGMTVARTSAFALVKGFVRQSAGVITSGGPAYWVWTLTLMVVFLVGVVAWSYQLREGFIVTGLRDQVSWGFYIGNFAFLVGVAAAAVVLVIPAYVYHWPPIKEIVLFGELMAVAAIVMCLLFVTVDIGRPESFWHLLPVVGTPNFPYSMLSWDVLVLSGYFVLNYSIASYLVYKAYTGRPYSPGFVTPLVFLSIPFAIGIHTVTAFLFSGLAARPFWHTAILAPRFIASAFCSGPALMVLVFEALRRYYGLPIRDAAFQKIGELLAYAMAVNLFFIGAEAFTEFYAHTSHVVHAEIQWFGAHGVNDVAFFSWVALTFDVAAFAIFLTPALRRRHALLCIGCLLAAAGSYVEKGLGLLIPGMTPDMLGEFYAYRPTVVEVLVSAGVWAFGALLFTWMSKIAAGVVLGSMRHPGSLAALVAVAIFAAGWSPRPAFAQADASPVKTSDSCVACHSDPDFLVTHPQLYEYFRDWQRSIHGQENVTCSDCHGGDPEASDAKQAHAEFSGGSAVGFTQVHQTCGDCHDAILEAYLQSKHLEMVNEQKSGRHGPTCVTCHRSMNTRTLDVTTVEAACARCHDKETGIDPEVPAKARDTLNKFLSIDRFHRYVAARMDPADSGRFFHEIDSRIEALAVLWHTFDLQRIEAETQAVLDVMRQKRDEIRKRPKND